MNCYSPKIKNINNNQKSHFNLELEMTYLGSGEYPFLEDINNAILKLTIPCSDDFLLNYNQKVKEIVEC